MIVPKARLHTHIRESHPTRSSRTTYTEHRDMSSAHKQPNHARHAKTTTTGSHRIAQSAEIVGPSEQMIFNPSLVIPQPIPVFPLQFLSQGPFNATTVHHMYASPITSLLRQQPWGVNQLPSPMTMFPIPAGVPSSSDMPQATCTANHGSPAQSNAVQGMQEALNYWINTSPSLEQILAYQQSPSSQ